MALDDLKWIVPMVLGASGFAGCVIVLIRHGKGSFTALVLAVLSTALVGSGVLSRLSLTKDGVVVETALANLRSLESLEKGLKLNTEAIEKITARLDSVQIAPNGPSDSTKHTEIQSQKAAGELRDLVERNKAAVEAVAMSNQDVQQNVLKLKDVLTHQFKF
jgi:hypothetical protein